MSPDWEPHDTSTHQDHVIAHVLGATVLGHFVFDQAAHLVLDIGFIWTVFADGEMGLVPQSMALSELEVEADAREELQADVRALEDGPDPLGLRRITPAPDDCLVLEVGFQASGDRRRLTITGEGSSLVIDTSLLTGEIHVAAVQNESGLA
ncbi:MAG TPA: hypothetical protein VJT74_08735 [Pyrinomonadaceae bacterium]|nr:hypothetical protein [Pyrinomonadaceae bacterium]